MRVFLKPVGLRVHVWIDLISDIHALDLGRWLRTFVTFQTLKTLMCFINILNLAISERHPSVVRVVAVFHGR